MPTKEELDYLVEQLHENAVQNFKSTKQYELLKEKLDHMNSDCESMFTEDERTFATECFELLSDVSRQQEQYIYRQGLSDGVTILKRLGVLV